MTSRQRRITIRLPDGSLFEDSEIATAERGGAQGIARGAVDPREASAAKHQAGPGADNTIVPPAVPLPPGGAAEGTAGVRPQAASSAKLAPAGGEKPALSLTPELSRMGHWRIATKFNATGARLADGHYSRRSPGSPQFLPPGQTLALVSIDGLSVFGWWRPHPRSGIRAMNGLDGWTCTIFRTTGGPLASVLIIEAECALRATAHGCGPDGLLTYVWDAKVASPNPGYCFKRAGWHVAGQQDCCATVRERSADGKKTLLHKPWSLAGNWDCLRRAA